MSSLFFPSYLNNYFNFHVCLSIRVCVSVCLRVGVSAKKFPFLKWYHKVSLIKVAWCMSSMKNMHPGSPSDPSWTAAEQGEAKLHILDFKTTWSEFHHLPRVSPKQLCALAHLGCTRAAGTS